MRLYENRESHITSYVEKSGFCEKTGYIREPVLTGFLFHKLQVTDIERSFGICNRLLKYVKMKAKTYIAYLRQSTVKQEISGLGVEAQREIIQNHLKNKKPIAEYIETESGRKSNRPKLIEALEECRKTGSTLIVAKLDRLSRNVAFTSKLLESDVEIVFCDFPEANKLVLHIISSIAEYEAGLISQRTRQSLQAKKARGCRLGKSENLTNNLERAIGESVKTNKNKADNNPNNMRAIAMLHSLLMQGKSLSEMTVILNRQGFVTSKGCKFRITQVKRLIVRAGLELPQKT